MVFNTKITATTQRDAEVANVVTEGVVEGSGVLGSAGRMTNLKLNMIKCVPLEMGGSGTSTDVLFAGLDLPDMLDTDYSVIGGGEYNPISSKATTGFTVTHTSSSTATFDVMIVGNWDE